MQHFVQHYLIDELYRGSRNKQDKRDGFGIQLYLNGFVYIGKLKDNSAHGHGIFIHNTGTYLEGVVRYFNGAVFNGTVEIAKDRFDEGTFSCKNGIEIYAKYKGGKILSGTIKLPQTVPGTIAGNNYPTIIPFHFYDMSLKQSYLYDNTKIIIEGPVGVIIKGNKGVIIEGTIIDKKKVGDWYEYSSPVKYRWFKAKDGKHKSKIKQYDITKMLYRYMCRHLKNKELIDWFYTSGIHVKKMR